MYNLLMILPVYRMVWWLVNIELERNGEKYSYQIWGTVLAVYG
jgi:hypothetical protein